MEPRRGFVLAGGRSRRMGSDKALLEFRGETMLQTQVNKMRAAVGDCIVVGRAEAGEGVETIVDTYPGEGPLGGILTALAHTGDWIIVLACDMPLVGEGTLRELVRRIRATSADAVVPRHPDGQAQPLAAAYRRSALKKLQGTFDAGQRRVVDAIQSLEVDWWEVPKDEFLGVNTPAEYAERTGPGTMKGEFPHYIEFRHVHKTFDKPILVDANFHINSGQTVAIVGRSGVGKSVSLGHIMGFLKPDEGQVIVAHEDITHFNETELRRIRKKVTMVFQSGALFDSLSVGENIEFSLELRDDYDAQNKEDVINGLLDLVGLAEFREVLPTELSTGHRRAVAIARALAAQPECILYDEPTTMVDPIMSDHLGNLMLRLKKQLRLTSAVVTHDLDLMRKVADTVIFLHDSRVIYFGPVSGLDTADHPHIREFMAMDRVEMG